MVPLLPNAPIDEVIVGVALDRAVGPDPVEAGVYLASRADRFTRHEIHDPIFGQATENFVVMGPQQTRTWLISSDDAWLIQLQHDRFLANWRRRSGAPYPGFTRDAGVLGFAMLEFERLRQFCQTRRGIAPNAALIEITKIDLLVQGKHWTKIEDVYDMIPAIGSTRQLMTFPGYQVALQTQEDIDGTTLTISVVAARIRAEPERAVFRVEFRAARRVMGELSEQLKHMNTSLNAAFLRLIPDAEKRFA